MNLLERVPAVRRIDTDRSDLFAFELVGRISGADVDNLYGLLEAAYALHPRIDVLVRMVDHESVEWQEINKQTMEDGRARAIEHVARCAVGEPDWTGEVAGLFSPAIPVEIRHFDDADEALAWEWLGATPPKVA